MKADPIFFKYGGRVLELKPETSLRIRKYAADHGITERKAIIAILKKTKHAGNGLFLPARC